MYVFNNKYPRITFIFLILLLFCSFHSCRFDGFETPITMDGNLFLDWTVCEGFYCTVCRLPGPERKTFNLQPSPSLHCSTAALQSWTEEECDDCCLLTITVNSSSSSSIINCNNIPFFFHSAKGR